MYAAAGREGIGEGELAVMGLRVGVLQFKLKRGAIVFSLGIICLRCLAFT